MLRVVGCITQEHDLALIALACLVCALATNTTARLLADGDSGYRPVRSVHIWAAVLALSTGVWATHFIALLAYRPGIPLSFNPVTCALSLVVALGMTAAALTFQWPLAFQSKRVRTLDDASRSALPVAVARGVILAAAIAIMHFVGMSSVRLPGVLHYDAGLVIASPALGTLFATAAMCLLKWRRPGLASVALMLAVASTHFVAMAAVTFEPLGGMEVGSLDMSRPALGFTTGAACLLILALAVAASSLDNRRSDRVAKDARRFRALADATFEGLVLESRGFVVDVNQAMCRLAGRKADTLIGLRLDDVVPGLVLTPQAGDCPVEHVVPLPDGQTRPVEVLWREGVDHGGHVVAIRDLSREKAAESKIERLSRFDSLTGLANREMFEQQLQQALARSDRGATGVAILDIELDRFEELSEMLGPGAGEKILVEAAQRLTAIVRETDTVARMGRHEFAIIACPVEQPSDVAALADRVATQIALPFLSEDQPLQLTTSIGIALHPEDGSAGPDLARNAALARRQAKTDGKGWRYFEPLMDLKLQTKRALELDLRTAVKEGQFFLQYQPFVRIQSTQLAGYEALVRWNHPECGRISPAEFIPLAEETGLIVPIGKWVLATACAEAASWNDPVIVSVNLSPAQFVEPGIVATVADVLRRTGLPPARLELEITEGTLMADTENALRILKALKALGIKLAMDDFGTGYSSLSYLRKFPFDKIKIDRSFITGVEDNAEAETIVQAIITLGRNLGLKVTAEGVETRRQLDLLRKQGCTFAQGYLLGHPHTADQLGQHIEKEWPVFPDDPKTRMASSAVRSI